MPLAPPALNPWICFVLCRVALCSVYVYTASVYETVAVFYCNI